MVDQVNIANQHGTAILSPLAGASLRSLEVIVGSARYELLDGGRAPSFDPHHLGETSGSFLMAPWVNRIRDGHLPDTQGSHTLPTNFGKHAIHGTVRDQEWEVVDVTNSRALLETSLCSPWPFRGRVHYAVELAGPSLRQRLEVHAGDGEREFPASVGWHPWFVRSLGSADLSVRADVDAQWEIDDEFTPSGVCVDTAVAAKVRRGGRFAAGEVDDCFSLRPNATIALDWPELSLRIDNSAEITHLMLYSPPRAICVEPQTATVNAGQLAARGVAGTGLRTVRPGQPLIAETRWTWSPAKARA